MRSIDGPDIGTGIRPIKVVLAPFAGTVASRECYVCPGGVENRETILYRHLFGNRLQVVDFRNQLVTCCDDWAGELTLVE